MESAMNYKIWEKKADAVIKLRNHMRYVGVFALDGDLIAHAGAPGVQQDVDEQGMVKTRVLNVQIRQLQAKAVVDHIKCHSIGIVKIDIAHLQFICFSHGLHNMVGMSNFNAEASEKITREMDDACFRLSRRHYTRMDSLEGNHLLNIAATLWKDVVIIGIGLPGNVSCLSAVQEMTKPDILHAANEVPRDIRRSMDEIRNMEKGTDIVSKLTESVKRTDYPNFDNLKSTKHQRKSTEESTDNKESIAKNIKEMQMQKSLSDERNTVEGVTVNKRPENIRRTKSVDDVIDVNNSVSAAEDIVDERVKSATIRSIEALRNIGPFTGTLTESAEGSSELMRSKSTDMLIQKRKKGQQSRSKSISGVDSGAKLGRRPSRATMV